MTGALSIKRERVGNRFIYKEEDRILIDSESLKRIKSLAIPPAWQRVNISTSPNSKILAQGYDSAGRRQAIYNPKFRAKQEKLKFDRVLRFSKGLPELRRKVDLDLAKKKLSKDKVLSCIVKLIDNEYFRVGNEKYARENESYGITTLRHKHLDISGTTVTFDFIGKSGKEHIKQISDKHIAHIIKQLDELPGYEIFRYQDKKGRMHDISNKDVNDYIKESMGDEFSAKDFRTWGGTVLATAELVSCQYFKNKKDRKKMVTSVVKNVAKRLGNTPTIARSSYIDPRVIAAYVDSNDISRVKKAMQNMSPRKYMTIDELSLLKLLETK
jgi:DNA topoisomerase-1